MRAQKIPRTYEGRGPHIRALSYVRGADGRLPRLASSTGKIVDDAGNSPGWSDTLTMPGEGGRSHRRAARSIAPPARRHRAAVLPSAGRREDARPEHGHRQAGIVA